MANKKIIDRPEKETLSGLLKAGKTIDWICEKWNVTPQTVRVWISKFNLKFPEKKSIKTKYTRKSKPNARDCPVCMQSRFVHFIATEKHWYCTHCDVEFDRNNAIHVYDENGNIIEVLSNKSEIWEKLRLGKAWNVHA
ncbi:helix-turn-helix domain-containing protein [Paenibacillus filicis]|uniref:Helix-turn-helix domain-containing protein n=1 Tax=Paenibacillus gyeongsangnamensis TaxID=3388067 RepID=A0ABT4QE61_9BACL|nr:helix-turn-helix domain-containing protein [Paenibacillus filicis]MCZ8515061.1 helix-turn-helix domain-containing protein [Paenibacillus filicis]